MKLYRYRTIDSALWELDSGSFYFAAPTELNDPIEGYLKILSDLHNRILLPDIHQFDNSSLSRTFAELGETFLTANSVQKVVEFYGNDETRCYGREMDILRTVTDDIRGTQRHQRRRTQTTNRRD